MAYGTVSIPNIYNYGVAPVREYYPHICDTIDRESLTTYNLNLMRTIDDYPAEVGSRSEGTTLHFPLFPNTLDDFKSDVIIEFHKRVELALFDNSSYEYTNDSGRKLTIKPFYNGEEDDDDLSSMNQYYATKELTSEVINYLLRKVRHSQTLVLCINNSSVRWFEQLNDTSFVPFLRGGIMFQENNNGLDDNLVRFGHRRIGYMFGVPVDVKPYIPDGYMSVIDFGSQGNRPLAIRVSPNRLQYGIAPYRRNMAAFLSYGSDEEYSYVEQS